MINFLIWLLPLIGPAIRYVDNPRRNPWRLDLVLYALLVLVGDLAIARLYFYPRGTERTVSDTLERLCVDYANPDWERYYLLAYAINSQSPGHIKNME